MYSKIQLVKGIAGYEAGDVLDAILYFETGQAIFVSNTEEAFVSYAAVNDYLIVRDVPGKPQPSHFLGVCMAIICIMFVVFGYQYGFTKGEGAMYAHLTKIEAGK